MNEEAQEVPPKWLKELEEKRERRVKARLGHEAGAGSPCLTCEDKCPGLDLHFWRKICKNCKCGKENHDVNDDDIYGWAQFQLLGSKPNKGKKFAIPGRKDEVELEWMPKGQNDVVESYLKDLPLNLLPIKGSAAAQERKQLLQKQIPLHDIDPTLCHALTDHEIKQMNDYIAHVKQSSVGMGHIMKLNEFLNNRRSANAQILASRAPMQLPQGQNIVLQGVDRANALKMGDLPRALRDLSLDEQKSYNVSQGEQTASNVNNIRDVLYDTYGGEIRNDNSGVREPHVPHNGPQAANQFWTNQNSTNSAAMHGGNVQMPNRPMLGHGQVDYQTPANFAAARDLQYPMSNINADSQLGNAKIPNQLVHNQIDYQNPTNVGGIRDVHYNHGPSNLSNQLEGLGSSQSAKNMPHFAKSLTNLENVQRPVDYGNIRNVYPDMNVNFEMNPELLDNVSHLKGDPNMPHYAPGKFNTFTDRQNPQKIGNIKDLAYSTYDPYSNMDANNENLQGYDPKYPHLGPNQQRLTNLDGNNENLQGFDRNYDPKRSSAPNQQPPTDPYSTVDANNENLQGFDRNYDPNRSNLASNQRPTDPYSNVGANNENLQGFDRGYDPKRQNLARPHNYNPHELNISEQNLNPAPINVGIINDIEYPTIKAAVQRQNDLFEPYVPRRNVQFDLAQDEVLPSCHKCKEMFDPTALVIGIDRTDALWHAECFKCTGCNQNLADLMYFYHKESDDIYCGRDYAKIRGIPRCRACDELIFVKEYCLAENSTFHVKHFCCFECDEPLAGRNYVMEDSQPLCLPCFEKVKAEKCNACLRVIKPDEQGANLNGVHFHADDECFACKMCRKPLLGAKLLFKNRNLYCSAPCFSSDK